MTSVTGSVIVVFGTRPEIIKLAPVVHALGERAVLVHTGQHFDRNMSDTFLEQLHLGQPDHQLEVGGLTRGAQLGRGVEAIESLLLAERPAAVLVQGDTNAGLAGALAANAAGVPLAHLEAGLRSYDRRMPEEHNRVLIDALADLCLVPIEANAAALRHEGVADERIRVVGSTLREALEPLLGTPPGRVARVEALGLQPGRFVLATIHRAENADDPVRLRSILAELAASPLPVLLPLHPRTRHAVERFGLGDVLGPVRVVEPLGYEEFVQLAAECALIVSDSGGVQEEATIVKRPVVIVRRSTERPELLGTFAHLVEAGPEIGRVVGSLTADIAAEHRRLLDLPYPYGTDVANVCATEILRMAAGLS